jgi:hypothetical protein
MTRGSGEIDRHRRGGRWGSGVREVGEVRAGAAALGSLGCLLQAGPACQKKQIEEKGWGC